MTHIHASFAQCDLDGRISPRYVEDVPACQKTTFQVKAFEI